MSKECSRIDEGTEREMDKKRVVLPQSFKELGQILKRFGTFLDWTINETSALGNSLSSLDTLTALGLNAQS